LPLTELLVAIAAHVLTQSVRYAPLKDFGPIRLTDGSTVAFDASDNLKACTVAAFISDAKAIEKETRIGSGGNGSPPHLLANVSAHAAISRWRIPAECSPWVWPRTLATSASTDIPPFS